MSRSKRSESKPAKRVKLNVSLDAETARRLKALASYRGVDACSIVSSCLDRELAGFVVYERAPSSPPGVESATSSPAPLSGSVGSNGFKIA